MVRLWSQARAFLDRCRLGAWEMGVTDHYGRREQLLPAFNQRHH